MLILSIILGLIFIVFGVACMLTPLATFMDFGYFIALLLLIYGIINIIIHVARKEYGPNFVVGLLAAILGLIIMIVPGLVPFANGVVIYLVAIWFLFQGVITIWAALRAGGGSGRVAGLILGIIEVALAIFSFAYPAILAVAGGVLIGLFFVMIGARFLASPLTADIFVIESASSSKKKSKK